MIGETIKDRYQVEELLKETPFVKTYRVHDKSRAKNAILRVMYFSPEDHDEIPEYQNQLKIFQQLYHPQIPRFLDSFTLPNDMRPVLGILSEHVNLTPLNQILEEQGRIPEDQALAYLLQLTRIMEYLHSMTPPFIHQALHPGNISIGDDDKLYLTGFTLVRKDEEGKLFPLEVSMDYTAPEQMKGVATHLSDLYAIGITGVEMVTGQKYNKIYRREFQSHANISTDFVNILKKLVEKVPEQRYQSASELKGDFLDLQKSVQEKLETLSAVDAEIDKKQMVIPILGISLAVLAVLILIVRPFFRSDPTPIKNEKVTQQGQKNSGKTNSSGGNTRSGLALNASEVSAGEKLTISYQSPGNLRDWIGISPANLGDSNWEAQFFLNGKKSGDITYKVPSRIGEYEVRLYHNWPKGQYDVQERQRFQVTGTDNLPRLSDPLPEVELDIHRDLTYQTDLPSGVSTGQSNITQNSKPQETLLTEPAYSSSNVGYGYFLLGNGEDPIISYALDDNLLYVDKNNNEDLTDDGEPIRSPGNVDLTFNLQDLQGSPFTANYRLWFFSSNMGGYRYYAKTHYTGFLNIQGTNFNILAFEGDTPDALFRTEGVYIDLNNDNQFSEKEKVRHNSVLNVNDQQVLFKIVSP